MVLPFVFTVLVTADPAISNEPVYVSDPLAERVKFPLILIIPVPAKVPV
jgi:hypothetical protein